MVVRKNRGEFSGKFGRQSPEQRFLFRLGKAHQSIGHNDRVQTIQDCDSAVESSSRNKVVKFLGLWWLHRCFTLLSFGAPFLAQSYQLRL